MSGQVEMLNRGNRQDCEKRRASVMKIRNELSQSREHAGKTGFKASFSSVQRAIQKIGRVGERVNRTVQSFEFVIESANQGSGGRISTNISTGLGTD